MRLKKRENRMESIEGGIVGVITCDDFRQILCNDLKFSEIGFGLLRVSSKCFCVFLLELIFVVGAQS